MTIERVSGADFPDRFRYGASKTTLLRTSAGRDVLRADGQPTKRSKGNTTDFSKARFVAWDGEGISPIENRAQNYVLFGNSRGRYIRTNSERDTLRTARILDLLISEEMADPHAIHVIFGGSYDTNMILVDLSDSHLERLWYTGRVYWNQYRLEWRRTKYLKVTDRELNVSVTLWDVWPFFQTSFLKALRTWSIGDVDTLDRIEAGKKDRNGFRFDQIDEIERYWRSELDCLVKLMQAFHHNLKHVGFHINRWDGPGAVASWLYRHYGTKAHKLDISKYPKVREASQHAYAGGRIELIRYGNHEGRVYLYDINSAYPSRIAQLPSLVGAKWVHHRGHRHHSTPFSLYRIRYTKDDVGDISPLWHRADDGSVNFGEQLEGWYWTPEYDAAVKHRAEHVEVVEWYEFVGDQDSRPFAWVEEMYRQRLQWKQEGNPAERILKLGLNSLYGKMCQQVGWQEGRQIPPYHQLEWAGYVTSATRAQMYDAAMTNPDAIVGFETDGIITTGELTGLTLGKGLGEWSVEEYSGVTYVQVGVYWLRNQDGTWSTKHRGFDSDVLTRDQILKLWSEQETGGIKKLGAPFPSTRFRGLGISLHQNNMVQWRSWTREPRLLRIAPDSNTKRHFDPFRNRAELVNGLHDTLNMAKGDGKLSRKHKLLWVDGERSPNPIDEYEYDRFDNVIWEDR